METTQTKVIVDELRTEWKSLWQNRIDDKVRAEGTAKQNYSKLAVEQGTVIVATRDYKHLEFFDIVEDYIGLNTGKAVIPNTTGGGWSKFVRNNIHKQKNTTKKQIICLNQPTKKVNNKRRAEEAGCTPT